MAAVSLTDYSSQLAELQRRQKLADLLSQQGQQEIPIQSSGGIQAPIPWTSVLAKALNTYAGSHIDKQIADQTDQLHARMQGDLAQRTADYFGTPQGPQGATMAPVLPLNIRNDDYGAMANLPAPTGPRPIPQMAAPPPVPPPMAAPPLQPTPGPAPGPVPAPDTTPAPAPVPSSPLADPLADRKAAAQAKMQKALAIQNQFGQTAAAPFLKDAQEELAKVSDLQTQAVAKEADRQKDVQSAIGLVRALPDLDPQTQQLLAPIAAMGGMKALTPALTKLIDNKLGPTETYMTPQQMQAAGFGPGSIVVVNSVTKEPKVLVDGTKVAQENTRIALERQNVGLYGAHLALDRQKFAFDQQQKANAIIDPATIRQMAMQARQGDTSVFQNLGRGVQGAQNIVALRQAIFDPALGPMTGQQMAQMNANFKGVQREQSAIGNRAGQAAVGASEVPILARQADTAYSQLSRADLVPYNQLKRMVEGGTSNPQQKAAFIADNAAVIARARALSPTGVPHLADIAAGEKMLNDAIGPAAHRAALNQFILEAGGMKQGAANAMGTGQTDMSPIGAAHAPYADPAKEARYQAWLKANGH